MDIKTLKNFAVYVDGARYGGSVTEGEPPKIVMKTIEHSAGGMLGVVDVSTDTVEKMEFNITVAEYRAELMALINKSDAALTFRGAAGPENTPVVIDTRGLIRELDLGAMKMAEAGEIKIGCTADYFKLTVGGKELIEIDVANMVFRAGGVDHAAGLKAALGY